LKLREHKITLQGEGLVLRQTRLPALIWRWRRIITLIILTPRLLQIIFHATRKRFLSRRRNQ
jgi:hypothetical protein